MIRKSAREPSNTATKIKGRSSRVKRDSQPTEMFQNLLDLVSPGRKEFFQVPFLVALFRVGTDRPQWVRLSESFPVLLQFP